MKKTLRNTKTKSLLSQALIHLMKEKTFDEIKLNEICEQAMVHKTTFYNHFQDKYDLLHFVIEEIQMTIKQNTNTDNGLIAYYLSIAKQYIKNIKEYPSLYVSLFDSNTNGVCPYIVYDTFVEDVEREIEKVNNISVPSHYIAKFYVNAVFSVINEWVITGMRESEDKIVSYIETLIRCEKRM